MAAEHLGGRLKTWRFVNGMKQITLAHAIGVSQPAITRWERGLDMPSPAHLKRLEALMAGTLRDELALERLFISRQSSIRALYDYDGMRMIAVSAGFRSIWPDFSALMDVSMADHLINEARCMVDDEDIRQAVREGVLGLVSGISERHTDVELDVAMPHRWHACFRRYGAKILVEVAFEPCAPHLAPGIVDLVRLDALDGALMDS